MVNPAGQGIAPQVQDGARRAARALEDAGYAVDEIEPPSSEAAARLGLDMVNVDTRAAWQLTPLSMSLPAETMQFISSLLEWPASPPASPAR